MSREEMNAVLSEAVEVACYFLQKRGEFFPFALGMDQAGGLRHIQGWTGDESPPSNSALDFPGLSALQVRLGYTPLVATSTRNTVQLPAKQLSARAT